VLKSRSLQWKNEGQYPADAGSIPINRKKNRFKDILPCKPLDLAVCLKLLVLRFVWSNFVSSSVVEYTRVQLHLTEGIEHSDYINANYINVCICLRVLHTYFPLDSIRVLVEKLNTLLLKDLSRTQWVTFGECYGTIILRWVWLDSFASLLAPRTCRL